jgi:uncharacterized repeat protein (TIGR01451 family)
MGASKNKTVRNRTTAFIAFLALALVAVLAPGTASAQKISNPSPPDFYGELTGGFIQLVGGGGAQKFELSLDFEELGLARPSFRGTVSPSGDIFVPQAQLVFPPLNFDIPPDTVNLTLLPTAPATGKIDPLTGRVDFRVRLRIQGSGNAQGVSLGGSCFVGSAAEPIDINGSTHAGVFPAADSLYQATFEPNGAFLGGIQEGGPYTDEPGVWPSGPTPPGGTPVPPNVPRTAGSFRIGNDTLRAIGASGCGPLGLANGPLNDAVGLPSQAGDSTAVLDFTFVVGGSRTGPNAIVQKGVKSNFTAPGLSTPTWPSTEVPELPTTVGSAIDASTSSFSVGPNPAGRYSFDLGTGSYGPFTDVASQPITFATPGLRTIRVRARDADGDIDTKTRQILVVPSTDIGVSLGAVGGQVRAGSNGVFRIGVSNVGGTRANTQPLTVTTDLPAGTTYVGTSAPAGWSCSFTAPTVTCNLPVGQLDGGSSEDIDVTVAVDPTASTPLANTASVVQAGDPVPGNNSATASTPVVKTDLALAISHSGDVVANGTVAYDAAVTNVGDGPTVGNSVVSITLPPKLSFRSAGSGGTGWNCVSGPTAQDVTCTQSGVIAGNASAPALTVVAKVDRTATGLVTVNGSVAAQADTDAFGGVNADSDDATVLILPDLALASAISGDFVVGDPGIVTLTATNESVVDINGPTTVTSTLPAGLTVDSAAGTGWDCAATVPGSSDVSCSYAAGLLAAEAAPNLTVTLAVDHGAYPGTSVSSALANAQDGFSLNNSASSSVAVKRLDVDVTKTAVRDFSVGIDGQYRISVNNVGDAATVGPIRVLDVLPPELKLKSVSGGGWDCSASVVGQQDINCVQNSPVAPASAAAVINVRVDVLDAAADAGEVVNTATVDTDRDDRAVSADDPVNGNNSSTATTKAVSVDLSLTSTHGPVFRTGTVQTYSLKVRNVGTFDTIVGQPVNVVDTLPAGMVPQTASIWTDRAGWTCSDDGGAGAAAPAYIVTCVLAAPSPTGSAMNSGDTATIEIPVAVGDSAVDPSLNVAELSTEKDNNVDRSPNNRTEDPTAVSRIDLALSASQSIPPRAGGIGQISVDVTNNGTAGTVNPSVVTIPLSPAVSYRPTGSTIAGWLCESPGTGTQVTCTRSQSIGAGDSAPPLRVRTNVGAAAQASWSTDVSLRTQGEVTERLADNDVAIAEELETIDLKMLKTFDPASIRAGTRSNYQLSVENIGNTASTGTTRVTETVDSTFGNPQAAGPGWSCQVSGQDIACTRTASIAAGETSPPIAVSFDVPIDAAGTRNSVATLTNSSDPFPGNNSVGAPIQIVASADVTVSINQPAAMRVGEVTDVSYVVRNIGTDSTSGDPSVGLKIEMPASLEPVGADSTDNWDCSQGPAAGNNNAYIECGFGSELAPGQTVTVDAQVRVLPTSETETGTLARVSTAGDVNRNNDVASAVSSLSGLDLSSAVAVNVGEEDLEAGVTKARRVTITNEGTAATTAPVTVKVPLPAGVEWTDTPPYGTGWSECDLIGQTVTCSRSDILGAGNSYPPLRIDVKPARANAPSVTINYSVETLADENAANDTATRTDTVLFKPETNLVSAPSGTTTSRSATVDFTSDDPAATFECKLDLGAFEACTSPVNISGLSLGGHSFVIRAINANAMVDPTPAEVNWTVVNETPVGDSVPIKADLTSGSLSLAALGEVPLPGDQLTLNGSLFENGSLLVPQSGVVFQPIEQTLDAPGIGQVTVKISISATGPGSGNLPNGGGNASFNLPVQAKLEALLGTIPLIGPDADCFLRPISFDLAGTYDEAGKTASLSSPSVTFPTVSAGCGALGNTVNDLLELPRSDIAITLNFAIEKGSSGAPKLNQPVVRAAKRIRPGKAANVAVVVRNSGDAPSSSVRVCIASRTRKLIRGRAVVCRNISSIAAGRNGVARLRVATRRSAAGKRARWVVTTRSSGQPTGRRTYAPLVLKK